ncbi:MAG: 2-keto-4-pentenoate hydratase [Ilumatobacteraceae bacterium]
MTLDIDHWVGYLLDAADRRVEVAAVSGQTGGLSIEAAYDVQDALVAARVASGDRIVGAKLGVTSKAKQQQMGIDQPAYGWLLGSTQRPAGTGIVLDELIHPRCEPEIVFRMATDLEGPGVTRRDVLDATASVSGGIEIIDSRYERFKFTLPDVIADNTSAAQFVVGTDSVVAADVDLRLVECAFEIDGTIVASASGDALLGHPADCVALLANHLAGRGGRIEAGWIVLAGAMTDAFPLVAGARAVARYSELGVVAIHAV